MPLGVNVGNIAGYVSRLQSEGMGARAGLRAFRDAGGAVRDSRWYNTWGEVAASKAGQVDVGAHPLNSVPSREVLTDWHAGKPGQFATQVRVFVRERAQDEVSIRQFTHVTDSPHTGQEAIDAAIDTFSEGGENYAEDVTGAYVSGYYQMRGMPA